MYGNVINRLIYGVKPAREEPAHEGIIPVYPPADQYLAFLARIPELPEVLGSH